MDLRRLTLVASLALFSSGAIGGVCGGGKAQPGKDGHFVTPSARPTAPYFYFRLGDYVFLAEPAAVLGQLDKWSVGTLPNSPASALRSRIVATLPLRANTDLYGNILEDPDFWFVTRALVIDLIEAQNGAVIDEGGTVVPHLYIEHDRQLRISSTHIRLDRPASASTLISRLDCIAD